MRPTVVLLTLFSFIALAGCGESREPTAAVQPPPQEAAAPAEATPVAEPAAEKPAEQRIFDMPYLMKDLDNGLRVIIVPTDYPDIVTIQIPVQTGSRNEVEPGKSGFAHFFEHMMFRGTEKYPQEVYGDILKKAGADQNAYTTDDYTNYHITFTKADLEKVIELEADRFQNLSYSEEGFRTEAQAVKGEYLKNYSNPIQKLLERIRDISFDTHTYKHTTMGFFEDIEDMPNQLEYSRTFFDRWYRPEKSAVILVGDLDPDATLALVEEHWGSWEAGDYDVPIPAEAAPTGPKYEHIVWEAETQPWIVMAFHGPAFNPREKDMPAMDVISQLYFSDSSDVYQQIVIENQWADQFFPYFPDRKDPQLLYIGARLTAPENAVAVREAVFETFAKVRTELIDAQRLDDTKSRLKYTFASQLDSSDSIGGILAAYVQFERTPETINELYRSYDAITPEDIRSLANTYFTDTRMVTVTLGNEDTLPGIGDEVSLDAMTAAAAEKISAGGASASAAKDYGTPAVIDAAAPAAIEPSAMQSASSPLVDVSFVFHVGAASDPAGKHGLAALTAAMLTEGGSQRMTTQQINEAMYPLASGFNAQVDKEMTRLSGQVHKDNLERWYVLVREQLLTPGWRQDDLDRLKTQLINAIRTDLVGNNDEELGKEALYSSIYGDAHPYGSYNFGAVSDIESITMDDLKAFYAHHYSQANLTLGLAGGYPDEFVAQLRSDLGKLPGGERNRVELPAVPAIDGHEAIIVEKPTPAVAVSFGFPIDLRRGDPDWVALWLVRSWFGEHRSSNSHLYQRIRAVRGMNYGDYAYIEYFPRGMFQFQPDANLGRQQQIFQVWIRPLRSNNDAHFATRVAMHELKSLIENGLTAEQFEATRSFLEKYVSLLVANQSRQLGYKIDSEYYGTDSFTDYVRAGLARLTLEDVNRVIRENLQTDNIRYVFITADAADLKERLVSDQPSPLEYNTEKPAELLDEDKLIEASSLQLEEDKVMVVPADELF